MVAAARERPDDPIGMSVNFECTYLIFGYFNAYGPAEYLAAYLIEHNPKKKQKTAAQAGATGTSS